MDLELLVFALLAGVGLSSAVMVITRKNLVHSAMYLIVTFFSVAAVYVLLHAEFLAVVQVLVYAGGIMVLFLFVIMLVDLPREVAAPRRGRRGHVAAAALLTALVVGSLGVYVWASGLRPAPDTSALGAEGGNLETVAITLFRYYLLPFEVVSILLLVAMVGAITLAKVKI